MEALQARCCAVHPDSLAVDTCTRCGAFTCADCLQLFGDRPYCARCFSRGDFGGEASARSKWAVGLGAAGMLIGLPASLPALLLAFRERKAWRCGETNAASAGMANAALILGWIGLGVSTLLLFGSVVLLVAFVVFRAMF